MKKALVLGANGMDGSYLCESLLEKGYEVHGMVRKVSHHGSTQNIDHIKDKLTLHIGSLSSFDQLISIFSKVQPDEAYNLAAQSFVPTSYDMPTETFDTNALGPLRIFEAVRLVSPGTKVYNAMTSEAFGKAPAPQGEDTPFAPTSTYACAKIASYYQAIHHRNAHNLFISNGILFNHTSPRRPEVFVTRKITKAVANIHLGKQDVLYLGNLDTGRDFGFSKDYVEAMWAMLQQDEPGEFVIATGICTKLRDLLDMAFSVVGLDWEKYVQIDPKFFRPIDHHELRGDYSKAKRILGWEPKTDIKTLVRMMVENDLELARG